MDGDIAQLIGLTLTAVKKKGTGWDEVVEELHFYAEDGRQFKLYHDQDCCEHVWLEDINGDLEDLVGSPILIAEESSSDYLESSEFDCFQWTFYRLATVNGYVNLTWRGTSNGYYSMRVDFTEVE